MVRGYIKKNKNILCGKDMSCALIKIAISNAFIKLRPFAEYGGTGARISN